MRKFIFYLFVQKKIILLTVVVCLIFVVGGSKLITPTYERKVILRLPYNSTELSNIISTTEIINAEKTNNYWIQASGIRNTNLIKLVFKGENKNDLQNKSEQYLKNEIPNIKRICDKNIKDDENGKLLKIINNKLDLLLIRQEGISENDIESLKSDISNLLDSEISIEYDDKVLDMPSFPPSLKTQLIFAVIVGLIISFLIVSLKYIKRV